MNYDYSPFNPIIWGAFIATWAVIWIIANAYRKKYRLNEKDRQGD